MVMLIEKDHIINLNTVLYRRNIFYNGVISGKSSNDCKALGHIVSRFAEHLEHLEKIFQYKFQSEIFL